MTIGVSGVSASALGSTTRLERAATALEAQVLSEMLKAARIGEARESFGGGAGEAHFASFLRDAYAEKLAEHGGIGIARTILTATSGSAR